MDFTFVASIYKYKSARHTQYTLSFIIIKYNINNLHRQWVHNNTVFKSCKNIILKFKLEKFVLYLLSRIALIYNQ